MVNPFTFYFYLALFLIMTCVALMFVDWMEDDL